LTKKLWKNRFGLEKVQIRQCLINGTEVINPNYKV